MSNMKSAIVIVALFAMLTVALVRAQGIPTRTCPPGEHSVLYCPQKAEPSCDNPTVHDLTGTNAPSCGVPQCFCNKPTVRNTKTGKCVSLAQCKH